MSKAFSSLSKGDLARLPRIARFHFNIGEEIIHLHLYNNKQENWFLAEYDPEPGIFFGFFINRADGISSGLRSLDEIASYNKRGAAWEPLVDESWKPVAAKEISSLQGYITMMRCPPDYMWDLPTWRADLRLEDIASFSRLLERVAVVIGLILERAVSRPALEEKVNNWFNGPSFITSIAMLYDDYGEVELEIKICETAGHPAGCGHGV